jgi:TATA-binding protein-associated factor Taf7
MMDAVLASWKAKEGLPSPHNIHGPASDSTSSTSASESENESDEEETEEEEEESSDEEQKEARKTALGAGVEKISRHHST